jgi:hypothetical protein
MATPLQIGDTFPDILAANNPIHGFMASDAESFKKAHSDKTRVILLCKLEGCLLRIRAFDTKKRGVTITHLVPHSCFPSTHYTSSAANALSYLLPHHRATVIDNPRITLKQIQSNERLQFFNKIPYQQAYRESKLSEMRSGVMDQTDLPYFQTILHDLRLQIHRILQLFRSKMEFLKLHSLPLLD